MAIATLFEQAAPEAVSVEAVAPDIVQARPSQLVTGLALSASFGLALGARFGVMSMAVHAVAVPLGFVAVTLLAVPAFYIGMAHAGVELDARSLARSVTQAMTISGRVLAGLAPAMLLLAVTCEAPVNIAIFGVLGLGVGSALGLRTLFTGLESLESWTRPGARLLRLAFASFAALLGARIWWALLPLFGGAS